MAYAAGAMPPPRPSSQRTASNKTPRLINTGLVFTTVRKRQPISRVDLARVTGLLPSTVSLIVDDLLASGWLQEGEAVRGALGRRPRLLSLNRTRCVCALDVHPQRTTLAVVNLCGEILWQAEISLPAAPRASIRRLAQAIQNAIAEQPELTFEGIGICLPGRTDPSAEELVFAPNLRWPIVRLKSILEQATGLPVHMDNVANACARLEVWQAESVDVEDLVVIEVSEGLGAGVYVNGAIARGRAGMAGEFGHIQMQPKGTRCNCGQRGCWETLASNRAALRSYQQKTGGRALASFALFLAAVQRKDPAAVASLREVSTHLGRGLQMVVAALAPAQIVIVGEITNVWREVEPVVHRELRRHPLARAVVLRPAFDGASARLRSSVALVLGDAQHAHR